MYFHINLVYGLLRLGSYREGKVTLLVDNENSVFLNFPWLGNKCWITVFIFLAEKERIPFNDKKIELFAAKTRFSQN